MQEQRELRSACSDAAALLKWKFTQHVVVRDFLLAQHGRPLNSKAKSHALTPVFKMQRMHIPISDFLLTHHLLKKALIPTPAAGAISIFELYHLNKALGMPDNAHTQRFIQVVQFIN